MLRRDSSGRSSAERREGAWMSLRDRVTNILLRPSDEWRVIAREPSSVRELYLSYVAPLAAIGPLASVVGLSLIGYGSPVTARYRVALDHSITQAVVAYVSSLIGVYPLAFVRDKAGDVRHDGLRDRVVQGRAVTRRHGATVADQ